MKGKVVIVTGANAGIGKATALALANMGASVTMVCRDKQRGEEALADIRAQTSATAHLSLCDFSSFASIRQFAAEFTANHDRLDVLVNNAGALFGERKRTTDGFEMTFGVNHLGYFLLTNLLLDLLKKSAPSRVVSVSSAVHSQGKIDWNDLQGDGRPYGQFAAYANSKLFNVLFTTELSRRLEGTTVTANCLHPGAIGSNFGSTGSNFFQVLMKLGRPFLPSPEKGARTSVYLASSPEVVNVTGEYFKNCRVSKARSDAYDRANGKRLWEISARLVGLSAS